MTTPSSGPRATATSRLTGPARRARRTGGLVMIAGVVLLALNLRPAVNALGVVIPELREATGLSGTAAGILTALPPLCFCVFGFVAPWIASRITTHGAVLLAVVALTAGQLLRAAVTGPVALFAGSVIALAGIALGNVLLPGLIRRHFPTAIGPMTAVYTTVLMVGQTLGAGITIPVTHGLGGGWRVSIGMWAVVTVVALVPWVAVLVRRPGERETAGYDAVPARSRAHAKEPSLAPVGRIPVSRLARSPRAWAMAVFFGFQSLQAYVMFGWLTTVLQDAGMRESAAGGYLALLTAVGIPISAAIPAILGAIRRPRLLVIAFYIALTVGYLGLIVIPTTATWLMCLLIGFGLGSFPMGLALMAMRARTSAGTTALSGFGQSVGYLFAAAGPIGFGLLHDVSGGSTVPLIVLICSLVPFLIGGLVVAGPWRIEDDVADITPGVARQ